MEDESPQKDREDLQGVISEIRQAQQNMETLEGQVEVLTSSIEETESTLETLEGLEDAEAGSEILVPIGAGSYVQAEIKDPDKVLSNLGADLVAERTPEEVTKLIEKRKKDLEDSLEEAENKIEELEDRIEELRPKAQQMMARAQAESEELGG